MKLLCFYFFARPIIIQLSIPIGFHIIGASSFFLTYKTNTSKRPSFGCTLLAASRGFGAQPSKNDRKNKGGGNKKPSIRNSFEEAALQSPAEAKRVLDIYGGDVQQGTIRRIKEARAVLEQLQPLLGEGMRLKEEKARWDKYASGLGVLQRAEISPELWEAERRRNRRLVQLAQEHGITDTMIHNAFQKLTWDASAEARALRGKASLSSDMQFRLDKALSFSVQPLKESMKNGAEGRIVDVGSGTGFLVPEISRQGIPAKCIVGVDISSDMTRVACKAYPDATFVTADFLTFSSENLFDTVLFCMSIHDLPDPLASIQHALTLIRSGGGRIVISHPRGASHVEKQHRANPIMVPHLLPSKDELDSLLATGTARLLLPPPLPNDDRDKTEGYLCVIEKY